VLSFDAVFGSRYLVNFCATARGRFVSPLSCLVDCSLSMRRNERIHPSSRVDCLDPASLRRRPYTLEHAPFLSSLGTLDLTWAWAWTWTWALPGMRIRGSTALRIQRALVLVWSEAERVVREGKLGYNRDVSLTAVRPGSFWNSRRFRKGGQG
jgi:hypothetical protein